MKPFAFLKTPAATSVFLLMLAAAAHTAAQTPDTRWYAGNPGATSFTISTADELAGLAEIVNGTWNGEPKIDNFFGKTVTLANDIDLSSYDNWMPIGDNTHPQLKSFSGTFNGGGHVITNLTINRPGLISMTPQGLFGRLSGGKVKNLGLDNVNIVAGGYAIGGLAGSIDSSSNVANCYTAGTVVAADGFLGVGGVVGLVSYNSSITNSHSTAAVSGNIFSIGGVAGAVAFNSVVADCYSTGTVSDNGMYIRNQIGGVVGAMAAGSRLINSYSTGAVSGFSHVGGVVGGVENGHVINCYSTGEVKAIDFVGGVAGGVFSSSVINCYSTSSVRGWWYFGGVAGFVEESSKMINCAALNSEVRSFAVDDDEIGYAAGRAKKANNSGHAGRVAGGIDNTTQDTLSNNVAFDKMIGDAGNIWSNKGEDNLDGADITAEALSVGTIGGLFTDTDVWTIESGRLPGLFGKTVPMPEHLGGSASVKAPARRPGAASSAQFVTASNRTLHLRLADRGRVDIYALNGSKLRTLELGAGSHTLRMADLPRGVYVARASSGAWKQSVRMMVK